jgi:signal transduction histidine kinase
MRWGALLLTLGLFIVGAISNALPDAVKLGVLLGSVGAGNAALWTFREQRWTWSSRSLLAQIVLDVIAITLALHFTGGVENPFQAYYLFPVIVSGVVLPARQSYATAALASLAFLALSVLEYTGTIAHHDVAMLPFWNLPESNAAVDQYRDPRYIAGASTVLLSTIAFACSVTTSLVQRLRRGERELSVEKGKLEAILRAMGEGVAYFDEIGRLVLANDAFRSCLGAEPPPSLADLLPGELRNAVRSARDRLHAGLAFHSFEVDDRGRTIASGVSAVRDSSGALVGLVWMIEDVTVRRGAQKEAERRARLADLGVLAAGIAHEVMNPLSSIASTTALLESSVPEPLVQQKAGQVRKHVERITRVVRGIADLARSSESVGAPVPLDHVLAEAVARAREDRRRPEVEIATQLPLPSPLVRGAEEPLIQVFHNLVKNSLDAAGDRGRIDLRAEVVGDRVRIAVEDDGPGVPPEVRERIFMPFFTTKEPGSGAGLGLAIAASIVRRHEGTIELDRRESGGARFVVTLARAGESSLERMSA